MRLYPRIDLAHGSNAQIKQARSSGTYENDFVFKTTRWQAASQNIGS